MLSEADREHAKELWDAGRNLGEIARELGCTVYDLSPWLYTDTKYRTFRWCGCGDALKPGETQCSTCASIDRTL